MERKVEIQIVVGGYYEVRFIGPNENKVDCRPVRKYNSLSQKALREDISQWLNNGIITFSPGRGA